MVQRIEKIAIQLKELAKNILPSSGKNHEQTIEAKKQRFELKLLKLAETIQGRMVELENDTKQKQKTIKKLNKFIKRKERTIKLLQTSLEEKKVQKVFELGDEQICMKPKKKFSKFQEKFHNSQEQIKELRKKYSDLERRNMQLNLENDSLRADIDSQRHLISAFVRDKERAIQFSEQQCQEYSEGDVSLYQNESDEESQAMELYESSDDEDENEELVQQINAEIQKLVEEQKKSQSQPENKIEEKPKPWFSFLMRLFI